MRADNNGEGGIMALLSSLNLRKAKYPIVKIYLIAIGFVGASLFFGDGIITPAISVLSAVEGLSILQPMCPVVYCANCNRDCNDIIFNAKPTEPRLLKMFFLGQLRYSGFVIGDLKVSLALYKHQSLLSMVKSPHWAIQFIFWTHPCTSIFLLWCCCFNGLGGEAL